MHKLYIYNRVFMLYIVLLYSFCFEGCLYLLCIMYALVKKKKKNLNECMYSKHKSNHERDLSHTPYSQL